MGKLIGLHVLYLAMSFSADCERFYTVAKANKKEALIWKIAVLGRKKPLVNAGTFGSLAHAGIFHSSMSEMSSAHRGM
jgi:hypothetical protein